MSADAWTVGVTACTVVAAVGLAVLAAAAARYRRLRAENRALRKEKEVMFAFVHDVGEAFAESDSVEVGPLLDRALQYALRTTRAGAGVVYLHEPGGRILRARAVSGGVCPPPAGVIEERMDALDSPSEWIRARLMEQTLARGEGLPGEVAETGRGVLIEDAERDPRVPAHADPLLHIHSLAGVPMRFRQRVMGAMFVMNPVDGRPFLESDLNLLQALADQASASTHFALLREELDAKRRMDHDLAIARRIQKSLLPRELLHVPGLDLAAFNLPALEIGGDYYDVMAIDGEHFGIAIADVSGKGISGALLMSVCRSVLRAQAPGCTRPAEALMSLARALAPDLAEDLFVTVLYLVYNIRTREVRIARAGHERPVLDRAGGGQELVDSPGAAIGMVPPDLLAGSLRETTLVLAPGDRLTLYTDGITEAVNERDEEWGLTRLGEALRAAAGVGAAETLMLVQQRVMRFASGTSQKDDMTMVCLVANKDRDVSA
jgi:phosphoserine phosphatase RsbU/P